MRPFLLTAGSRGDAEPMFALCTALLRSPNVGLTNLIVSSDSMALSPSIGDNFKVHSLQKSKGINKEYLPAFNEDNKDTETHQPEAEIDLLGCAIRDLIVPETERLASIAEEAKCTIVITTFMTLSIAHIISQKLDIPLVFLQYQPVVPTRYYPHLTLNAKEAASGTYALHKGDTTTYNSAEYLESHYQFIRNGFRPCLDPMNAARARYELPPVTLKDMCDILEGKPDNTYVIVATQSQLLPRSPDMSPDVHIVGSLAASYLPPSWNPEETQSDLCAFLNSGPPPVVISYGSMEAQGVASSVKRALLSGLRTAGAERVVVIPGSAQLGLQQLSGSQDESLLAWANEHVFVTEGNVQFAWLLPQCEMIFCHCGAGTTAIALASGVPILATPIMTDQIYFAELIDRMKLGYRVGTIGLPSITAKAVSEGVRMARTGPIRDEVDRFCAEHKKRDESVEKVCQLLESFCHS